ncbi:MAG: hypothetical protein B7Y39_13395 [Bdellovibrio sp. 28-41-41]|nr:MAG: hypothetical protein B7Y39_13395 [Bdellovibrio sp. 28-41-41]
MSEFLRADCEDNQCSDTKVQAPRFAMNKDVYEGNLPATQDGLSPKPVASTNLVSSNGEPVATEGEARLPASETPAGSANKPI